MSTKPIAAVVVDPYSSGRFLLYELKERNIPIICIRSSLKLGSFFLVSYDKHKDYFAETIDYEEDLPKLLSQLESLPYQVGAVFAGCEPGVSLADILAEELKLPTANGTALSHARKDKAEMQEQLRRCGVPACEQFLSGDVDALVEWARKHGKWPLVAKPCCSSGSDGIFFCKSEEDVIEAHRSLIGTMTPNATINNQLVLQEFLDGTEYIVDTISHNGKHICIAMWVYKKRRGTAWNPHCIMCEGNQLIPSSGEIQDQLVNYVFQVLDAVGLKYGPCHTEVMMVERGPILVEVNARMHGLQGPHLIELSTGTSKAKYAVDVLMDEGKLFYSHYKPGPERYLYPLKKHCIQQVLISNVEGYVMRGIANAVYSLKLPSVIKVFPAVQKGQWLSQSCDLNTTAGCALMVNESAEQLEADRIRLNQAQESGLYEVSPEPPAVIPPPSPSLSPTLPSAPAPFMMASKSPSLSPAASPSMPPMGTPQESALRQKSPVLQQRSPRLQSIEKVEEAWASLNTFSLDAETGAEEAMDKMKV